MNNNYINPFLNATLGLFREYLDCKIEADKPYILTSNQEYSDIAAIVGMGGDLVGTLVLWFSRELSLKLVSKFAGKEYPYIGSEVIDGVGELVNIIAGNAKQFLDEKRMVISLPSVITGNSYQINWPKSIPIIAVPFKSDMGDFTLGISIKDM